MPNMFNQESLLVPHPQQTNPILNSATNMYNFSVLMKQQQMAEQNQAVQIEKEANDKRQAIILSASQILANKNLPSIQKKQAYKMMQQAWNSDPDHKNNPLEDIPDDYFNNYEKELAATSSKLLGIAKEFKSGKSSNGLAPITMQQANAAAIGIIQDMQEKFPKISEDLNTIYKDFSKSFLEPDKGTVISPGSAFLPSGGTEKDLIKNVKGEKETTPTTLEGLLTSAIQNNPDFKNMNLAGQVDYLSNLMKESKIKPPTNYQLKNQELKEQEINLRSKRLGLSEAQLKLAQEKNVGRWVAKGTDTYGNPVMYNTLTGEFKPADLSQVQGAMLYPALQNPSSDMVAQVTQLETLKQTMADSKSFLTDDKKREKLHTQSGALQGRLGKLKEQFLDSDPDRAAFYADLAHAIEIVYVLSGKQVSEKEMEEKRGFLPDPTLPLNTIENRITALQQYLNTFSQQLYDASAAAGKPFRQLAPNTTGNKTTTTPPKTASDYLKKFGGK